MRYLKNETWPSCDYCDRQLPSLSESDLESKFDWHVVRVGMKLHPDYAHQTSNHERDIHVAGRTIEADREHICPVCWEKRFSSASQSSTLSSEPGQPDTPPQQVLDDDGAPPRSSD